MKPILPNNKIAYAIIAILLAFISSTNLLTAQIISPTDDTYVRGGTYKTNNYGTETVLEVKQGNVDDFKRKAMLKFDLQSIGLDSMNVDQAVLRVYLESGDAACTVSAFEYPKDWSESTITWENAAALGTKITEVLISDVDEFYEWDVTSSIQSQVSGGSAVGIALYDEFASNANLKFTSSNGTDNQPELIVTTSKITAPDAPSDLQAFAISNETIILSWIDNSSNESGFKLERKKGDEEFTEVAVLNANTTNYNDTALSNFTAYTYQIRAYNIVVNSAYSNQVSASTTDNPATFDYHVDAINGDDSNDGLSTEAAWKSLAKVNATTFIPGSRILFKSGDVWVGQLYPKGSGNSQSSIVIDKYGGDTKPIIDGDGMTGTGVVYLYNQEYWEINNLEITNDADSAGDRRGVRIEAENFGTAHHIHLKNLHIHNIKGIVGQDRVAKRTSGVGFGILDIEVPTHFDDILVEGCLIHNCENQGIITELVSGSGYYPGSEEWENMKITNAAIRNNTIHTISKNAIIVRLWEGGVVEYNVCYNTANGITGNTIFSAACDGTVFQYNEGYENHTPDFDGSLYDADLRSPRTVWQYSYSHDNAHGLFVTCTVQEDVDVVCRYNISQNDKGRIFCFNYPNTSSYNYNNTIYVGEGLSPEIISERGKGGTGSRTYSFLNNLIYNMGAATYDTGNEGYTRYIVNNCFYGNHDATEPSDAKKITADPMLVAPGTAGIGINSVDGYKLQAGSPCIDVAINISNNGGLDYWGNALNDGLTDVGAHEFSDSVSSVSEGGIRNFGIEEINIYPNPLHGNNLTIDLTALLDVNNAKIKIYSSNGQLVYQSNVSDKKIFMIDIDNLAEKSIYFVSIQTNKGVVNKKLMVE